MTGVITTHGITIDGINHLESHDASFVKMNFERYESGDRNDAVAAVYAGMQPLTADDIAEAVVWATSQPGRSTTSSARWQ